MLTNTDITVFNSYIDEDDNTLYSSVIINGVNWQSEEKVTVSDKGLISADEIKIYIPVTSLNGIEYVPRKAYNSLKDKTGYFTLKEGDKIVKGEYMGEISSIKDFNKLDNVATIISVKDNRYGSLNMQHFEVGGV